MPHNQTPWRHHYIPEFYLKRWTSGRGTLVQFSRPNPRSESVKALRVYPRQTGFADRLYELSFVAPEKRQVFETAFFSPVDNKAASVLAKIEAGDFDLDGAERSAWSNFILSLMLRHPGVLTKIESYLRTSVGEDIQQKRKRAKNVPLSDLDDDLDRFGREGRIKGYALELVTNLINSEHIGTKLINSRWGLLRAPSFGHALLTSDRPVVWPFGIDDSRFHILLPIAPKKIFYAVNPRSDGETTLRFAKAEELTEYVNNSVVRQADRFAYALGSASMGLPQQRLGIDPPHSMLDQLLDFEVMPHARRRRYRSQRK